MPAFILNDESKVNVYGFRVPNKSISLERFKANPVILDGHYNANAGVIGRWLNLRIEGSCLMADTEFDLEDETAKKIAGKVDRGFLKGCSMGLSNPVFVKALDGQYETESTELMESSICAIPANSGALVRLYSANGDLMTADEIKPSLAGNTNNIDIETAFNNQPKMKQITLSVLALSALGMTTAPNENEVPAISAAIENLQARLTAETTARQALQTQLDARITTDATTVVDAALTAGKIKADERDKFMQLAKTDLGLAKSILDGMQGTKKLGDDVNNTSTSNLAVKTMEDFQKLTLEQQLSFKQTNSEEYKKLFGA